MSGIEKLGGTDRNYVKVAAGGRWCRNRRVTRCRLAAPYSAALNACLQSAYLALVEALVQSTAGCCVSAARAVSFPRF
jgi:hypothetical protein